MTTYKRPKPVFRTTKGTLDPMNDIFIPGALLKILMHGMTKQDILKRALVYTKKYPERRIYVRAPKRKRPLRQPVKKMTTKADTIYDIKPIKGKILVKSQAGPKNEHFEKAFKEAHNTSRSTKSAKKIVNASVHKKTPKNKKKTHNKK